MLTDITSGITVDWIYHNLELQYSFVYALRDKGEYATRMPPEEIVPTAEETLDSVVVLVKEVYQLIQGSGKK